MDSPPPPTAISTPSKITERAASAIACRHDAHCRSMVVPPNVTGRGAAHTRVCPGRACAQTRLAPDFPGGRPLLERRAHHHVLDFLRIHLGACDGFADGMT